MKVMSNAKALELWNKQSTPANSISQKERHMAMLFQRLTALDAYLRAGNYDAGVIAVPLPLSLTNGYLRSCHWAVLGALREQYKTHLNHLLMSRLLPPPPATPPQLWRVKVTVYSHNPMDIDNATAMLKWPQDFLVAAGYMIDDKEKHFEIVGGIKRDIDRKVQRIEFREVK